jgi:small subunit ribosomal protein S11
MLISHATNFRYRKRFPKFVFSKKPLPKGPGYFEELNYPRIYIRNNSKTLFFTLTSKEGRVLCSFSSGMVGLKGSKRLGTPAIDALARKLSYFARQLNFKTVSVVVRVTNNLFNMTAMKIFFESGLEVAKIVERVPISHNGTRFKKTRRI